MKLPLLFNNCKVLLMMNVQDKRCASFKYRSRFIVEFSHAPLSCLRIYTLLTTAFRVEY